MAHRHWDAYDPSAADITDPYLVAVARRINTGDSLDSVAGYVVETEINCLGVDTGSGIRERAFRFLTAVKSCL